MEKHQLLTLLKKDVVPALGCTEPVCVALCAAYASKEMTGAVASVSVAVNGGIYKNGMSAGIPNCDKVGLHHAAAIGAMLGNPEKGLQLLEDLTPDILQQVSRLAAEGAVSVRMDPEEAELYVKCLLSGEGETVTAVIRQAHTNLVYLDRNGEVLLEKKPSARISGEDAAVEEMKHMEIAQLRMLVEEMTEEELSFLEDGIRMNEALADYSREAPVGVGIGAALRQLQGGRLLADDLFSRIMIQVASAAENRLDGCPLPTMSSSGAGTKGLVVILPVSETAKAIGASREKTLQALAFAHLLNRYINAWVGKLSPMCSCVMASSTAACGAIVYLLGGTDEQIGHGIRNISGTVTGMICDGGKVGCALKVATGSSAALLCALTAVKGAALRVSDGICAETPEQCIQNMARIGVRGMQQTDWEILAVMSEKTRST